MSDDRRIARAERLYAALLFLYPEEFRRRFGPDMRQLFTDRLRSERARTGIAGAAALWAGILFDLVPSAVAERAASARDWLTRPSALHPRRAERSSGDPMLDTLLYDLRYAIRSLGRTPTFTAVAIIVVALGTGAVTTIFSGASALVLRPIPGVRDPGRVVDILRVEARGRGSMSPSYPFFEHLRDETRTMSGIAAWTMMPLTLSTGGQGTAVSANVTSANYFDVLAVRPELGRFFVAAEDSTPGGHPVIVLSDAFWRRRFAGDPQVIGRSVLVNGAPWTVIGVAPRGFTGVYPIVRTDAWVPMMMAPTLGRDPEALRSAGSGWLTLFGRLADGVAPERAAADLSRIVSLHLGEEPPDFKDLNTVRLSRMTGFPADGAPMIFTFIALLLAVSALVLVIASVNVGIMLLARAAARRREMAIRIALGAGRARLVRQLLTESVALFVAGATGGLLIAFWSTGLFERIQVPAEVPLSADLSPDYRVLLFTLVVAVITGMLFGLAPALQSTRHDPDTDLRSDTAGTGLRRSRLRNALVVAQMAVSLLLLMSAGLFLRALTRGAHVETGFETAHIAVAPIDVSTSGYTGARARVFLDALRDRLRAAPGVTQVSVARWIPLGGSSAGTRIRVPNHAPLPGDRPDGLVDVNFGEVGPDYFQLLGIPLVGGRGFLATDDSAAPQVAVVNEAFGRTFWPGGEVVGRVVYNDDTPVTIVGVARDAKYSSLNEPLRPFVYLPVAQRGRSATNVLVKTAGDPAALGPVIREAVRAIDPILPPPEVTTMDVATSVSLLPQRVAAGVTGALGLLGLVLAVVGLYGVVAYTVAQRTREIGIRMALGANGGTVLRLVLGDGMRLVVTGVVIGMLLAAGATRLLSAFLFGVSPLDPLVFALIPVGLGAAALLATWLPARRAAATDPQEALRVS
jgi:predicted permease